MFTSFFWQAARVDANETAVPTCSNQLELLYATQYGNYVAAEAFTMEDFYTRQYGNQTVANHSQYETASNAGAIEYSNSLALLYAQQYGNLTAAASDVAASGIEYTNSLELFYANQYGNQISVLVVDAN